MTNHTDQVARQLVEQEEERRSKLESQFIEDGYVVIRSAFNASLLNKIQDLIIEELLKEGSHEETFPANSYEVFCALIGNLLKDKKPYEILKPVWKSLIREDVFADLFRQPQIFEFLTMILGKDLCHVDDPSLTLNIPKYDDSKKNYLFKDLHQEVWSGTSINTIQFWSPVFQTSTGGGISLVKKSHLWGHIPHRNRIPLEVPTSSEFLDSDLELGDVIIFHSLLLHKTSPLNISENHRLAINCMIKNFLMPNDSFEKYRNFRIFSYSAQTIINRKLGNHYLSPFRLLDLDQSSQVDGL